MRGNSKALACSHSLHKALLAALISSTHSLHVALLSCSYSLAHTLLSSSQHCSTAQPEHSSSQEGREREVDKRVEREVEK